MNTQQKILDQALKMFNERGIEYVGLRELAAELGIRVGNITYYFPTKDDLVYALAQELAKANAAVLQKQDTLTLKDFMEIQRQVFRNQLRFRCLPLSFVHLMKQNKHLAATYRKTQKERTGSILANLHAMEKAGAIKKLAVNDTTYLVSAISLISRFWISEAAVSFRTESDEEQMEHYLSLISNLLRPFAQKKMS